MPRTALKHLLAWTLVLVVGATIAACGDSYEGSGEGRYGAGSPDYSEALAGSPAPLAGLHRQSNQLLEGGADAFQERLAGLDGFPVVVNKWASWCGPCRAEFPFFQNAAARLGKKVGFLGVNSQDSDDAAKTFLREYPVPYPSYSDPDQGVAAAIGATLGFPSTAYYDRAGEQVYLKQGGYATEADLLADIRRYALSPSGQG